MTKMPSRLGSSLGFVTIQVDIKRRVEAVPGRGAVFISLGSLGWRCSLGLAVAEDFPILKKENKFPTGDFFALVEPFFLHLPATVNGYYFTSAFSLNYENITILKPVQTDRPLRREGDDGVEFSLQGCRPLSHINILAVWRHRRDELGLSPGLGFL